MGLVCSLNQHATHGRWKRKGRAMRFKPVLCLLVLVLGAALQGYPQAVTLVTIGDSLTAGDGDDGVGGGYPARLLTMLTPSHPGSTLQNLAVSGHTSDDLINVQLDPAVSALNAAPAGNRKLGLVWIGSNDLFGLYNYVCDNEYGNDYTACEAATFGYFSDNIDTILSALSATGAEVFIALLDDQSRRPVMTDPALRASVFDQISDEDVARMSVQVGLYNTEIASQAAALSASTVDFFHTTIFENWATLDADGNHPNGAGYDAIADIWYAAVSGTTPDTFRLTVSRAGTGSGSVTSNPAGIDCGSDCSHDYQAGTSVTLTATPAAGSTFSGWSGDCSGTGSCVVAMSANRSVTATFAGSTTYDNDYVIPVVAHNPGGGGTNWRSSVVCLNTSGAQAHLNLVLTTSAGSWSESLTVPAGASEEWEDIVVTLFGQPAAGSTAGALHIASDQPLRITSRTFNQGSAGTYGQYLPALVVDDALTSSDVGYLLNLKGIGFRTNAGLVNLGSSSCQVRLSVFNASGATLGSPKTITLDPGRWTQKNDVFAFVGAAPQSLGYATVEVESGACSFWAYASVVDDTTGDATTIPVLGN
jgi:lysophospholipase L1-like esterase